MAKTNDFGKQIKKRLIDLGESQEWLIARVKEKTGLYFDSGYLWKIMSGVYSNTNMEQAIRDILELP